MRCERERWCCCCGCCHCCFVAEQRNDRAAATNTTDTVKPPNTAQRSGNTQPTPILSHKTLPRNTLQTKQTPSQQSRSQRREHRMQKGQQLPNGAHDPKQAHDPTIGAHDPFSKGTNHQSTRGMTVRDRRLETKKEQQATKWTRLTTSTDHPIDRSISSSVP